MIRRRRWKPPKTDPKELEQAKSAVQDAVQKLTAAMAQQPEVDEVTDELKRIRRENHMAHNLAAAFGAHRD